MKLAPVLKTNATPQALNRSVIDENIETHKRFTLLRKKLKQQTITSLDSIGSIQLGEKHLFPTVLYLAGCRVHEEQSGWRKSSQITITQYLKNILLYDTD